MRSAVYQQIDLQYNAKVFEPNILPEREREREIHMYRLRTLNDYVNA